MNENEIIAEYIKERYPELLETFDFTAYKLNAACRALRDEIVERFVEVFSNIDLKKIAEQLEKASMAIKENIEGENNMSLQDLQEELYNLHQMRKNGSISEEEYATRIETIKAGLEKERAKQTTYFFRCNH